MSMIWPTYCFLVATSSPSLVTPTLSTGNCLAPSNVKFFRSWSMLWGSREASSTLQLDFAVWLIGGPSWISTTIPHNPSRRRIEDADSLWPWERYWVLN